MTRLPGGQAGDKHGKIFSEKCIFLPELRIRILEMDGAVPVLPRVEYICGGEGAGTQGRICETEYVRKPPCEAQ